MWAGIWALLTCLPEILNLLKALGEQAKAADKDRKVKSDLEKISKAFKDKNADLLRDIFKS